MVDLKDVAEELVRLSTKEVQKLAEVMKEEYGIEAGAAEVSVLKKDKALISRQERRKREREALKKEVKKRQKKRG